ncbi:MAG: hypothetical protein NT169_04865 [Chloroflexi bacterium]|nr:hypothetical protein [Chloroflexota bacterium]
MSRSAKENLLRAIYHRLPSYVPYAAEGVWLLVNHRGRKPPRDGVDEWGVTWAPLPASYMVGAGEPAESHPVARPVRTAAELLTRSIPDGRDRALFAGLLDGIDQEQTLVIGQHGLGPFERFLALLGAEHGFSALLSESEASFAALERIADYHAAIAAGYLAAGVEAGWLADDYAGTDGPLIAPKLWRRMVLPGLARIIAVYRDAGAAVFFHTCGRAEAFIGDLLDAGVTVFNLQNVACDLPALKARYGRRIAFYGGVPSEIMQCGSPADVRRAALAAIQTLGQDGGLILAADQPLAYPAQNEAALVDAARHQGDRRALAG